MSNSLSLINFKTNFELEPIRQPLLSALFELLTNQGFSAPIPNLALREKGYCTDIG